MITIDTEQGIFTTIKYEPYELVSENDPILKRKMPLFNNEMDRKELSNRLIETLKKFGGLGLSANQCGLEYNVFVMGFGKEFITLFNPKIIFSSDEKCHMAEGCLSFPFLMLTITRPSVIRISAEDENGNQREFAFDGITARIAQHEIDHLQGITFDTIAKPLALKTAQKKREKNLKRYIRHNSMVKK